LKKIGPASGFLNLAAWAPILLLENFAQGPVKEGTPPESGRRRFGRPASRGMRCRGDFTGFWPNTLGNCGTTAAIDSRAIVNTGSDENHLRAILAPPPDLLSARKRRTPASLLPPGIKRLQVCSYNASALVTLLLTILRIQRKPEEPPYRSLESYEPGQNFSAPTMPTVTQAVKEKKVLPHWYFRIGNSGFASPTPKKIPAWANWSRTSGNI
jgi:hypothetical protein